MLKLHVYTSQITWIIFSKKGGKFDRPDRLFNSIIQDYKNCMENPGTVKELIPEFY